jgi:hypothetical protein
MPSVVRGAARLGGGDHPRCHADRHGDEHRREREQQRVDELAAQIVRHRGALEVTAAQVAARRAQREEAVLGEERFVEPPLMAQRIRHPRVVMLAHHDPHGVARRGVENGEADKCDADHHRRGLQQPPGDVARHGEARRAACLAEGLLFPQQADYSFPILSTRNHISVATTQRHPACTSTARVGGAPDGRRQGDLRPGVLARRV